VLVSNFVLVCSRHDTFCSCNFLGECFLSLLFDLDFFFKHAAPLMVVLHVLLQSLVIAVILEAVIRRPERKVDLSNDMTSKYIAYADYLLLHCTSPSKTDRWVIECLKLMQTDWLPATSENAIVPSAVQSCNSAINHPELPSYAFFWQHQQLPSQQKPQDQRQNDDKHQISSTSHQNKDIPHQYQHQQHLQQQERPLQQVKKRLKALPPLRITAAS
jgi:hypothetical protein